ncbi:MAG: hypothetical protein ACE1Z4_12490, partial [Gammaproteobacteria bacterium]
MTIDQDPILKPDALRQALAEGRTLIDQAWLEQQRQYRPRDRLLLEPAKAQWSHQETLHAIKYGPMDATVHPVAESILAAEAALDEYERKGTSLVSPIFYRVLSLRDIARDRHCIGGIEQRLPHLMTDNWKSTLHELITAVSYLPVVKADFLAESKSPTPDLALRTKPPTYVECKARHRYEQDVISFVQTWQRESLATIKDMLLTCKGSFFVRVNIETPLDVSAYTHEIPLRIQEMVGNNDSEHHENGRFHIDIDRRSRKLRVAFDIEGLLAGAIISSAVNVRKPDRRIYQFLLEQSGYRAED